MSFPAEEDEKEEEEYIYIYIHTYANCTNVPIEKL